MCELNLAGSLDAGDHDIVYLGYPDPKNLTK
jgi:hypothetical protein